MKQPSPSQQKRGFNIHAFVFVATMALLVAINLSKGEPYWILWVLFGWGIGLLAHWWFVLGPGKAETTRADIPFRHREHRLEQNCPCLLI